MPSSARIERFFSIGRQPLEPRRETNSDKNVEASLFLEFNEYYLFYKIVSDKLYYISDYRSWFG